MVKPLACHARGRQRLALQGALLTGELKDVLAGRTEDEEAMCAVCSGGLSIAPNLIVFCERCDIAVHQKCYGVDDIPAGLMCRIFPHGCNKMQLVHGRYSLMLQLSHVTVNVYTSACVNVASPGMRCSS